MKQKSTEFKPSMIGGPKHLAHPLDISNNQKGVRERLEADTIITALSESKLVSKMLATQMLSTYDLQQKLTERLQLDHHPEALNHSVSCITKLSNLFINQIEMLRKLQNISEIQIKGE